jgi:hypothetical protein
VPRPRQRRCNARRTGSFDIWSIPLCGSRMNLVLPLNQLAEQVKEAGFAVVADVVDIPQA